MHYMLTGVRHRRPKTNPQNAPDDFPCFGAVMNFYRRNNRAASGLPAAISLNSPANQISANNHIFPGFFAGFLGSAYDPMFVSEHANQPDFRPLEALENRERFLGRKQLLTQFDRGVDHLRTVACVNDFRGYHEQAFQLLASPAARRALDIAREPEKLRSRYGMTPFGQGCLLARRLVENGVPLVTVNWERDDAYWDTHADNFKKHKDPLLPNMDRGFSALLEDMDDRGLLDETLVVCLSEFGRTPKINAKAGRDHWAACNSIVMAGAGIVGGQVYGDSDRQAAYPVTDPVSPEDLASTIFHLLGVDSLLIVRTREGQPLHLSQGKLVSGLL
jgi:arylsulfatase A-like enzyme